MVASSRDLQRLPAAVRARARVRPNGEVEWPRKVAPQAIAALASAGLVVLGLALRSYPSGKTHEAPWTALGQAALAPPCRVKLAERAALGALQRADELPELDAFDWILVTW
jgi:hypothetical protein